MAARDLFTFDMDTSFARRTRDRKTRGAAVVVRTLVDLGVHSFFGIPGGAISPVNDALLDVPKDAARVVVTRHEAEAVFAACGHFFASGTPAAVFVTSGPGATNALTGIAAAQCDGVPLVVLVGEVPRAVQGRGALQDGSSHHLNIAAVARSLAKASWEAVDTNGLAVSVRRAFAVATSGRPGPVVLTLPLDVLMAETFASDVALAESHRPALPEEALARAFTAFRRARRPVVLAGAGARRGEGPAALLEFAERFQVPVITTPKGKGVFPESHSLALGVFGIGGHPSAQNYLAQGIDTLLCVGSSLGDLSTDGFSPLLVPTRALVHVDIDGRVIGRHYAADLGIVAPLDAFLRAMTARLGGARASRPGGGVVRFTDPRLEANSSASISPARALWELQRVLPTDAMYAIDSGEHFLFAAHYLELDRPDTFFAMTGLGAMGSSIGVALGAQMARPERRVVVVMGDGGFGMIGTQIADAVAERLGIVVCVFDDGRLTMCERGHENVYGRTPTFATPRMDVAAMARAMGAGGLVVERAGDITNNAELFSAPRDRPLVVHVKIDPNVAMPKTDRIGALGKRAREMKKET